MMRAIIKLQYDFGSMAFFFLKHEALTFVVPLDLDLRDINMGAAPLKAPPSLEADV